MNITYIVWTLKYSFDIIDKQNEVTKKKIDLVIHFLKWRYFTKNLHFLSLEILKALSGITESTFPHGSPPEEVTF